MEKEKVIKGLVHMNAEKVNKVVNKEVNKVVNKAVNKVVNKVVKSESLNEQP